MTIDEAIEVLKNGEYLTNREEEQIAEWLEELKRIEEEIGTDDWLMEHDRLIRNKAIDDFVKEICKMIVQSENNGNYRFYAVEIKQAIADLAEQLKAGVENEF